MTKLEFVASIVHSLAWPVGAGLIVVILHNPIGAAMQRLSRARVGPVEAEFAQELAEVRKRITSAPEVSNEPPAASSVPMLSLPEELERLAEVSPRAAVLEAFARIEERLRELLTTAGVEVKTGLSGPTLARLAHQHGLITSQSLDAVEGLAVLRNLAAHSREDDIPAERARDYLALADAMLFPLRNQTAR